MSTFDIHEDTGEEPSLDALGRFNAVAKTIREWQEGQLPKMSDNMLLARFPDLGSTKTFTRALRGDGEELRDIESRWLPRYEGVVRMIENARDSQAETIYHDLPLLKPILADATRLITGMGIKRLMLIEGDTGHGKSFALRAIKEKFGDRAIMCEADESWFRASSAVGQLSLACGVKDTEAGLGRQLVTRINDLVAHVKGRRMILIDEFHHSGGGFLNILKTLINRTNSVFVVAGMKTLLDKLSTAAAQEARQLTHNRLFSRHTLTGPSVEDAMMFLSRRLTLEAEDKKMKDAISALIAHKSAGSKPELVAAHLGGMAFLRNVADECRNLIGSEPVDADTLMKAANLVKRQAIGR
jgi:type II secretory pathway predicted ATPase ExeA